MSQSYFTDTQIDNIRLKIVAECLDIHKYIETPGIHIVIDLSEISSPTIQKIITEHIGKLGRFIELESADDSNYFNQGDKRSRDVDTIAQVSEDIPVVFKIASRSYYSGIPIVDIDDPHTVICIVNELDNYKGYMTIPDLIVSPNKIKQGRLFQIISETKGVDLYSEEDVELTIVEAFSKVRWVNLMGFVIEEDNKSEDPCIAEIGSDTVYDLPYLKELVGKFIKAHEVSRNGCIYAMIPSGMYKLLRKFYFLSESIHLPSIEDDWDTQVRLAQWQEDTEAPIVFVLDEADTATSENDNFLYERLLNLQLSKKVYIFRISDKSEPYLKIKYVMDDVPPMAKYLEDTKNIDLTRMSSFFSREGKRLYMPNFLLHGDKKTDKELRRAELRLYKEIADGTDMAIWLLSSALRMSINCGIRSLDDITQCMSDVLSIHDKKTKGSTKKDTLSEDLTREETPYDANMLELDMPLSRIYKILEKWKNSNMQGLGLTVCVDGPTGSGKTALCNHIAEKLGKKIIVKTPSDLLHRYWGESEQAVRNAFAEAAKEDSVLLIDEIDTYLSKRSEDVSNPGDKSYNAIVNEFLVQLQNYGGVFLCTTNFRHMLDTAFLRRIRYSIKCTGFKKDAIPAAYKLYFKKAPTNSDLEKIKDIALMPADFSKVYSDLDLSLITRKDIPQELLRVARERGAESNKRQVMGFMQ